MDFTIRYLATITLYLSGRSSTQSAYIPRMKDVNPDREALDSVSGSEWKICCLAGDTMAPLRSSPSKRLQILHLKNLGYYHSPSWLRYASNSYRRDLTSLPHCRESTCGAFEGFEKDLDGKPSRLTHFEGDTDHSDYFVLHFSGLHWLVCSAEYRSKQGRLNAGSKRETHG